MANKQIFPNEIITFSVEVIGPGDVNIPAVISNATMTLQGHTVAAAISGQNMTATVPAGATLAANQALTWAWHQAPQTGPASDQSVTLTVDVVAPSLPNAPSTGPLFFYTVTAKPADCVHLEVGDRRLIGIQIDSDGGEFQIVSAAAVLEDLSGADHSAALGNPDAGLNALSTSQVLAVEVDTSALAARSYKLILDAVLTDGSQIAAVVPISLRAP